MAHHTVRSGYAALVRRINRMPQGAPPSELLIRILAMLFSEDEAQLVACLPLRPFDAGQAARAWSMTPAQAQGRLEALADKSLLVDMELRGKTLYVVPPPMAGFFEFALMRVRGDLDQQLLSELFYQYLNVEDDFIRALFTEGQTQLGRVFVQEEALPSDGALQVLDYERASAVIGSASHIGVGLCYCRHKMQHLGRACEAPMETCLSLNVAAASLIRHGAVRPIGAAEALDLLQQGREGGLVQFGENIRQGVNFICNCCSCCCDALLAARRFGLMRPVHTSNYLPRIDSGACTGCGRCVEACPVDALALVAAHHPQHPRRRRARLDERFCLGCGVCVRACGPGALRLEARGERVLTPVDSVHRTVAMAIERGKLQNLIFDNQVLWSHRALAAVFGAVLRLPPVKRLLASRQLRSRYLERLLGRYTAAGPVTSSPSQPGDGGPVM